MTTVAFEDVKGGTISEVTSDLLSYFTSELLQTAESSMAAMCFGGTMTSPMKEGYTFFLPDDVTFQKSYLTDLLLHAALEIQNDKELRSEFNVSDIAAADIKTGRDFIKSHLKIPRNQEENALHDVVQSLTLDAKNYIKWRLKIRAKIREMTIGFFFKYIVICLTTFIKCGFILQDFIIIEATSQRFPSILTVFEITFLADGGPACTYASKNDGCLHRIESDVNINEFSERFGNPTLDESDGSDTIYKCKSIHQSGSTEFDLEINIESGRFDIRDSSGTSIQEGNIVCDAISQCAQWQGFHLKKFLYSDTRKNECVKDVAFENFQNVFRSHFETYTKRRYTDEILASWHECEYAKGSNDVNECIKTLNADLKRHGYMKEHSHAQHSEAQDYKKRQEHAKDIFCNNGYSYLQGNNLLYDYVKIHFSKFFDKEPEGLEDFLSNLFYIEDMFLGASNKDLTWFAQMKILAIHAVRCDQKELSTRLGDSFLQVRSDPMPTIPDEDVDVSSTEVFDVSLEIATWKGVTRSLIPIFFWKSCALFQGEKTTWTSLVSTNRTNLLTAIAAIEVKPSTWTQAARTKMAAPSRRAALRCTLDLQSSHIIVAFNATKIVKFGNNKKRLFAIHGRHTEEDTIEYYIRWNMMDSKECLGVELLETTHAINIIRTLLDTKENLSRKEDLTSFQIGTLKLKVVNNTIMFYNDDEHGNVEKEDAQEQKEEEEEEDAHANYNYIPTNEAATNDMTAQHIPLQQTTQNIPALNAEAIQKQYEKKYAEDCSMFNQLTNPFSKYMLVHQPKAMKTLFTALSFLCEEFFEIMRKYILKNSNLALTKIETATLNKLDEKEKELCIFLYSKYENCFFFPTHMSVWKKNVLSSRMAEKLVTLAKRIHKTVDVNAHNKSQIHTSLGEELVTLYNALFCASICTYVNTQKPLAFPKENAIDGVVKETSNHKDAQLLLSLLAPYTDDNASDGGKAYKTEAMKEANDFYTLLMQQFGPTFGSMQQFGLTFGDTKLYSSQFQGLVSKLGRPSIGRTNDYDPLAVMRKVMRKMRDKESSYS
jgi:hypothetical protein